MDRNTLSAGAALVVVVICAFAAPLQMRAQDPKTRYPSMAPVDQYLMPDRDTEIALARSAAPDAISRDATIFVLGRHGYETAVEGKNGFVCAVERGWTAPTDNLEFWNPKNRSPICYNRWRYAQFCLSLLRGRNLYWPEKPLRRSKNGKKPPMLRRTCQRS